MSSLPSLPCLPAPNEPRLRSPRHPFWHRGLLLGAVLWAWLGLLLAGPAEALAPDPKVLLAATGRWLAAPLTTACAIALLRPRWTPARVGVATFALALACELSQLWHPHALEVVRGTLPGFWLLGGAFAWSDLARAAVAGALAAGVLAASGRVLAPRRRSAALDHPRPWGVVR